MIELVLFRKSSKLPVNQLVENIRRLRVQSGIDAVKIDSRVLKSCTSAHRSAQDRGTGNHIGKLPAHPHDFIGVGDAFKIETTPDRFPWSPWRRPSAVRSAGENAI